MKMFQSIGFMGGGRVTRFLLEGWKHSGKMPSGVRVADSNPVVLGVLKSDFTDIATVAPAEAAAADLVVLAVHPPVMKDVLTVVKPCLKKDATVLSLAPKFTSAAISGALGVARVTRMIPNAPSAIGKGFNPVAYAAGVDVETKAALSALFAPWGEAPEVPEKDLEAYALISGMGPTYMWFQWQALRELAVNFGLKSAAADTAILKMVQGAAECLLAAGRDPLKTMDMIPVKPLKDDEPAFVAAYKAKLTGLYEKIKT
jgi:pyrroline-5-carboxylate reductase